MEYTVFRKLKWRRLLKDLEEEYIYEKRKKKDNEAIENDFVRSCLVTTTAIVTSKTPRKPRSRNRNRRVGKLWWSEVYNNWSDDNFKEKMGIRRDTFNQILVKIRDQIELTPTNLNPSPTSPDRQLALTIYRLATGCSHAISSDVFGVYTTPTYSYLPHTVDGKPKFEDF